tara:strand:+ start:89 stop:724 length:636 start_codon:yes stop_codon:yes gene_type:complete
MSDDRIGQPMSLSQLVLLIGKRAADTQLERGDITKEEHKERIKILFPDLELVDNKAGGGMMNINDMIKPLGYKSGTKNGSLVGDRESLNLLKFIIPRDEDGNVIPFKKSDPKPFIIPRDKDGNIIPFEKPDPKPFIIPRNEEGNRIPFDPEKARQLLQAGLTEDASGIQILGMKLMLQEQANSLEEMDRIEKLSASEIMDMFRSLINKKGT